MPQTGSRPRLTLLIAASIASARAPSVAPEPGITHFAGNCAPLTQMAPFGDPTVLEMLGECERPSTRCPLRVRKEETAC